VDDRGVSGEFAWRLAQKAFSVAERFFDEERVDVCFFSELPEKLVRRIEEHGVRIKDHARKS
jgi:hypothetical protein